MTVTRRGKWTAAAAALVVVASVAIGFFVISGKAPAFIRTVAAKVGIADPPAPPTCPLTGQPAPNGVVPDRPALGVKVENLPEARPQVGLQNADIVYEEPVEGGITRFIVVFQCHDAGRVGPVRSGRATDPDVLVQFGRPAMGYAGGVNKVKKAIEGAGLIDVNYIEAAKAYTRDPNRAAPHDLYTTTAALYRAAASSDGAPEPVFAYGVDLRGRARRVGSVHLAFSGASDVYWTWSRREGAWLRSHGTEPHLLEDGTRVAAANVVVMLVEVRAGTVVDAAGNPSPEVTLTGSGKAYVLRDGRMIVGRWERPALSDVTTFVAKDGSEIALAPGITWVELLPSTIPVETQK
ncbi:MAG: DUF3048 domain-containing protein [Actinobacteria bacterium]|nr:DUF3048 domain-containing protein [Actinomycetota bacterium]